MSESYKNMKIENNNHNECNSELERMKNALPDIQNTKPSHSIYLPEVGIESLELPIKIAQKNQEFQTTIANISCFVDLKPNLKGVSMSRILEELHRHGDIPLNSDDLVKITNNLKCLCESNTCKLIYKFPYFIKKKAPVSNIEGFINHNVEFICLNYGDLVMKQFRVKVLATSLCPCSKEISENSAHNQKCEIDVLFRTNDWIWIEDIISLIENCASCEIYSILKRPDEKAVTERAYNNACFVEDIARNSYHSLNQIKTISAFRVTVKSDESIHVHKATATAQKGEINYVSY